MVSQVWWQRSSARGMDPRIVVVSDIDGSLLEPGSQSRAAERAALDFLAARGVPLVINSSRTRAEIERLQHTLQMHTPFISENGSALFLPHGFPLVPARARAAVGGDVIEFGKPYHQVVEALRSTSGELAVQIVSLADLSIEEAARELDVGVSHAQLAKLREYTEPFRILNDGEAVRSRLFRALRRRGVRCWRTNTHHLATGTPDRAESLRTLTTIWRQAWGHHVLVGLGDSEDDVSWLRYVDIPIIVQAENADVAARALSKLPTARVTSATGRQGWSDAVMEFVGGLLPARASAGQEPFPATD